MRRVQSGFVGLLVTLVIGGVGLAAPRIVSAACVGDCDGSGDVSVGEIIEMVDIALDSGVADTCRTGDADGDGTITISDIVTAVSNALNGCLTVTTPTFTVPPATATDTPTSTATPSSTESPTPTVTPTPSETATDTPTGTATPTPTITPTFGVLGTRHFVLDKAKSTFQVKIAGGLTIPVGNFQGQTNGQPEAAFLDLEAGKPDEHGFTRINIPSASEFIYVDATTLAGFVICIKPLVPVMSAGLLGCNGGMDVGISLNQDHHVGELGVAGFTAAQCAAQQGTIEPPYAICSAGNMGLSCEMDEDCDTAAGADDGMCMHFSARCSSGNEGAVCSIDADCVRGTNPGKCGIHPGVCNGPLTPGLGGGDSGPGELFIVPNPDPAVQLNGMPIELGFETALPCGDEGPGMRSPFALTTGVSQSTVEDANDDLGHTLTFDPPPRGENFSCHSWQSGGGGKLVLSAPAIDQRLVGDVATIFTFASK